MHNSIMVAAVFLAMASACWAQVPTDGEFRWRVGPPLLEVDRARLPESAEHAWVAIKDPSVVRYGDRWHLFCTLRKNKQGDGRIRIGYLSFDQWENAKHADWSVLNLTMGYHGAPQIFGLNRTKSGI